MSDTAAAPVISDSEMRCRMIGCWLGKAVGGTLGMPYEGVRHPLNLTYYEPVPQQMLPNDDLDAQVVYAFLLDQMKHPRVDRHVLSKAWQHIGMSPDEYGICKRNMKLGLKPPATGSYDNPFARGMGAAIRTELWACLAPGQPDLAAAYAYEDACMDHAAEGIDAAVFLAALESLAFVEQDRETLLDRSLSYLPTQSEVGLAIRDTRAWWAETGNWHAVQQRLADRYLTDNFTDVVINLAYIVLGWLAGDGDFGKSICAAVNAGQDTDCTGATLGALMGILAPDNIDDRWLRPIGRDLVLSPSVTGVGHPPTLDGFTDLVLDLRRRLNGRPPNLDEPPQDTSHLAVRAQIGYANSARLPELSETPLPPDAMQEILLPGLYAHWPVAQCRGEQVWVRYRVTLPQSQRVQLLFNTPEPIRLWFDGRGVLKRDGGPFVPAMHRAPEGQITELHVEAGRHDILAVMRRPANRSSLVWCIGLSDTGPYHDWLVGVFDRPAYSSYPCEMEGLDG